MNEQVLGTARDLLEGGHWTAGEARAFFGEVVNGQMDPALLAAVLVAIRDREPDRQTLGGAAAALLESATVFPRPDTAFVDIVGTGGDGKNTLNLSTIAALTAAACGCPVVKHGNRAITGNSGSFDLLESLHVPFDISATTSRTCLDDHGICFLFAPNYHPGLRHAGAVRRLLGVRTVFNLLGPLVNPARPPGMLLGVADAAWLEPMAGALADLGCQRAFVVHGGGVDEVAVHAPTEVVELQEGTITRDRLQPEDFGVSRCELEQLVCHDPVASRKRSAAVLEGRGSAAENAAVCVNVALLMKLFGGDDLRDHCRQASEALKSGQAGRLVRQLATVVDGS